MRLCFLLAAIVIIGLPGSILAGDAGTRRASSLDEGGGEDREDRFPHHHVSLFAGAATETEREIEVKTEFATGLEYELRLAELWGIGGVVEFVGEGAAREVILVLPLSIHFFDEFRLVMAPGFEFTDSEDSWVFRIGLGYEFDIGQGFTLAPEAYTDFIETGKITYVYGLALGHRL